jgi:Zn-dependent membrane protease YugP
MMFFDPLYLLFAAPGMLLAFWAQYKVKSTFRHYSEVPTSRGLTGAEIAKAILRVENVTGVRVEPTLGFLCDHYDPRSRTLRLSQDVYHGRTVAAAGVAAHEVGHAIQHARAYAFLTMRSAMVPMLGITSSLAMPTLIGGFVLSSMGLAFGSMVIFIGLILFATMVVFQLVTLPVELDASKRALAAIEHGGLVQGEELTGARKVLSAAALTYIAAAVSSLLTLMYFVLRSGLLGGSRND